MIIRKKDSEENGREKKNNLYGIEIKPGMIVRTKEILYTDIENGKSKYVYKDNGRTEDIWIAIPLEKCCDDVAMIKYGGKNLYYLSDFIVCCTRFHNRLFDVEEIISCCEGNISYYGDIGEVIWKKGDDVNKIEIDFDDILEMFNIDKSKSDKVVITY